MPSALWAWEELEQARVWPTSLRGWMQFYFKNSEFYYAKVPKQWEKLFNV